MFVNFVIRTFDYETKLVLKDCLRLTFHPESNQFASINEGYHVFTLQSFRFNIKNEIFSFFIVPLRIIVFIVLMKRTANEACTLNKANNFSIRKKLQHNTSTRFLQN